MATDKAETSARIIYLARNRTLTAPDSLCRFRTAAEIQPEIAGQSETGLGCDNRLPTCGLMGSYSL